MYELTHMVIATVTNSKTRVSTPKDIAKRIFLPYCKLRYRNFLILDLPIAAVCSCIDKATGASQ
jgi:hypothetical protein